MLSPEERAIVRHAVQHADDSVAQVLADSLSERGQLLGEFMQAAMMKTRDLPKERALLPEVMQVLRGAGLKWARQVSFARGLPVAARTDAERFFRYANEETQQWPLDELWLEGHEVGAFFAALGSPVFDQVSRLTLDGSIWSQFTMFVNGPPPALRVLEALRWLQPLAGELPPHWVPVLLPGFARVEALCVSPGVEFDTWLDVTPALKTLEVRLTALPDPAWSTALFERARSRGLRVLVNDIEVQSFDRLFERGLLPASANLTSLIEPALPELADERPAQGEAFIEAFDGQTVSLLTPKGDGWTARTWRREVHRELERLLKVGPLTRVAQLRLAAANSLRTVVTFEQPLQPLEVTPERVEALGSQLTQALGALAAQGFSLPAITSDMLYSRDGALELFPVIDLDLFETWRSQPRLVGLVLLPEHRGTARGIELLVKSVVKEWRTGHPVAPPSLDELSLRRVWRAI